MQRMHPNMDATFLTNFLCLALCNSNISCFTAVFQKQNGVCILYSKVFPTTELANSIGSNVYTKKCNQAQVSSSRQTLTVTEVLPTPTNNSATSKSTNTISHSTTDTTTTTTVSSNFTLDDYCLNKSWLFNR